jgi:hypothetical protein
VAEPREELSAAISNAMSMINDPDRNVRTGTLDRVSRAITKLEGFSFLTTPELLARVRECRTSLEAVGVQDLNSDRRIGAQLTEVLRATLEQTTSKTDMAAGKRQFRNIRVVQVDDDVTVGT